MRPQFERASGVETDIRIAGDEWIVVEARVCGGIGNQHRLIVEDGVAAEGDIAGRFSNVEADGRFEPLPIEIDEGDGGDWHAEEAFGHAREAVEAFFRLGIEEIKKPKRGEPVAFIGGNGSGLHDDLQLGRGP